MNIVLSNTSDNPLYQQIYTQVCAQIIKGELASGFCLPSIRTVAKELRISVITIKRAWEELERAGFIQTMVGKGCFVAPLKVQELDSKRQKLVCGKLLQDAAYFKSLGLSKSEVLDLISRYYDD
jgi:GntR family transcriptional regulator